MKRRLKTIAITGTAIVLLSGLLAALAVRLIDVERYRPQAEAAITEATGLDCSLGKLSLGLWPLPHLHSEHPVLSHAGQPVLQAERITISAYLRPLLRRRLELRAITVTKLTATLRRDRQGNLNLLPPRKPRPEPSAAPPLAGLHIEKIVLDDANLRYENVITGFTAAANHLNCTIGPFPLLEQGGKAYSSVDDFLATAALNGEMEATSMTLNALTMDQPALHFTVGNNTLTATPITASVYGGKLDATLTLTDLATSPQLALAGAIDNLDVAGLSVALNHKSRLTGRLHVTATLATGGRDHRISLRRLNGTVAMRGRNLTLQNIDLDTILTQYAKSQEIGLFDLASIFIVGPFGPLLSKAVDLSGTALGVGRGSSRITQLASDWTLRNGIATTKDVAFATPGHRLAFKGRLDFPAKRFRDFRIGVLDSRGCATFTQTVNGSFRDPQVEKASFFTKTIVNPLVSLFQRGTTALTGNKPACTPFYRGRVPHPATP
jgi:AsmA protein